MIDAALIGLLDGPTPAVLTPLGAPERWLKANLVTERFDHEEGTMLTLTPEGEAAARVTLSLKLAFRHHPEFIHAFTSPDFGKTWLDAGHSITRAHKEGRKAA